MAKMTEDELKALISAEIHHSIGFATDEMSSDREDGWNSYLKEPYGNEIEGRSKVISSDVQDTVEWILPSLIRIFTQAERSVEFSPNGLEDENQAAQATDYCNYVWNRDNQGFLNFYTWFKDALIAKLAWVKIYWEKREDWKRETYYDLDDETFAFYISDPEKEIIEHTETVNPDGLVVHDVTLKWKEDAGKVCVEPVPSDEVIFSQDAKEPQNCRFLAHRKRWYVSDLIEAYPHKKKTIQSLSTDAPGGNELAEAISRSTVREEDEFQTQEASVINEAMRQVWVTECYIRCDYNGDDIAEMRKVTVAGTGNAILDNDEWHGPRPFAPLSPVLMPHRLVGLSIPDLIKDLQLIKTTILRQYLDALYVGTSPSWEVKEDMIVDPAEVLTRKPNSIVRTRGPAGAPAIMPIMGNDVSKTALEGLNYVDQLRENRTGVSPRTTGLGEHSLHETATGEQLLYSAAQSRVELIARVFAETGVKDAFKLILWLANKYQDKARIIRLRNEWVPMTPSDWDNSYDVIVNVGLGNGDKSRDLAALSMIADRQAQVVQLQGGANGPMVTMQNLHVTASKMVEAANQKGNFFSDPAKTPPRPPQPSDEEKKIQAQMQLEQMKAQLKHQTDQWEAQVDAQLKERIAMIDAMLDKQKAERQAQIEVTQAQADIATEREKAMVDIALERQKAQFEMMLEERESENKMELERLKAQLQIAVAEKQAEMQERDTEGNSEV